MTDRTATFPMIRKNDSRMATVFIAVFFVSLTLAGWYLARELENRELENRFHATAAEIPLRIESRLAGYEQVLRGGAGFLSASGTVSRAGWRDYVAAQRLDERYPGIQAVGFAKRVSAEELSAHVHALRAEGFPDYRLRPLGVRDEYTAIVYVEPFSDRNARAVGYDMYTDPLRRAAMAQARDTGESVITRKVTLLQETDADRQAGFLMYVPYYASGRAATDNASRRAALAGYVYAPFRMNDFIQGTLGDQYRDLDLAIFDGTELVPDARLHGGTNLAANTAAPAPMFQRTIALNLYGQTWSLHISSLPGFEQGTGDSKPLLVLFGGLLISIVATIASLALAISRERSSTLIHANRELVSAISEQQTVSVALDEANSETRRILDSITDAFFVLDERWRFTYLNSKAEELLRRNSTELLHKSIWDEFPETVDTEIYQQYHRALREQKTIQFTEHYKPLQTWFEIRVYPCASGISVFFRDITRQMRQDEALRLRDRALESSINAIVITDCQQVDHPVIYVNPAFERMTGYSAAEVLGRNCRLLQGDDHDQPDLKKLRTLIREENEGRVVLRNYHKNSDLLWNELHIAPVKDNNRKVTHFVGVLNDITESRNYQNELERRATHDLLTGLANRGLLMDRLQLAAIQAKRRNQKVALLFIDLDGFKQVNDGFGHAVGDQVLKLTGNRLAAVVREGDTVGRLGGDEFVIVLNDQGRIEEISDAVTRIMESVLRPIPIQNHDIALTCSIGISVCPDDGEEAGALLKYADIAMYKAKDEGKNTSRFYTRGMNDTITQRITITNNLRQALERQEFLLHYQPQVDLRSGAVLGAEALVRWQHPQLGLITPSQFLPMAEESGQIVALGEWVINTACANGVAFGKSGLPLMAVNLSARQLRDPNLVPVLREALDVSGLPAQSLELEITESMVMANLESNLEILSKIKDLGIRLAMDDFGTGYASLSYLKRFPIDRLKIDKIFVHDVADDRNDAALVRAIIALAHNLGFKVVAEGVETREQRDFLINAGCDQAQGYFYSRPLVPSGLQQLIDSGKPGFG